MQIAGMSFREVWLVVFAFTDCKGEPPVPLHLVATEINSQRKIQACKLDLRARYDPLFPVDDKALCVVFGASAVLGCHLALNWPIPARVLDLHVEFRNLTNGDRPPFGTDLFGALSWYCLDGIDVVARESIWRLASAASALTDQEKQALERACNTHLAALDRLLAAMERSLDLPRALLRGRYMGAVARIENAGVPIDNKTLRQVRQHWPSIRQNIVVHFDSEFGVFEGGNFDAGRFVAWLDREDIIWPRLQSGALDFSDGVFRDMALSYPIIQPLQQLRKTLYDAKPERVAVGHDGRNRVSLRPFASRTGRNQPSSAAFIFGAPAWMRHLIKPAAGTGMAYVDWAQQEFGVAAALSGDDVMWRAYESGDPYLAFAHQAGAVPGHASMVTHAEDRERFKTCALAVLYGMGPASLARLLRLPRSGADELLALHRCNYSHFWTWLDDVENQALLTRQMQTVFGWRVAIGGATKPGFIRNFPMQASAAEMLRLACCLTTEAGTSVCAPIHDALLIESPIGELDDAIRQAQAAMAEASRIVLDGRELRTDVTVFRSPDRYRDPRGASMWSAVLRILSQLTEAQNIEPDPNQPARQRDTSCSSANPRPIYSYVYNKEDE